MAAVAIATLYLPCFDRSGRYLATLATPLADAFLSWLCCLLVVFGGCFAAVIVLLRVDTRPLSCCSMVSASGLGYDVLRVGSHVVGRLVRLTRLGGSLVSGGGCSASLLAFFSGFSLLLVL